MPVVMHTIHVYKIQTFAIHTTNTLSKHPEILGIIKKSLVQSHRSTMLALLQSPPSYLCRLPEPIFQQASFLTFFTCRPP